ncbi:hypothetical protein [Aquimarina sp. RZ0]|uniref:hypothetical protein n=1 Tax=Aquimarina sp. RZ0 TaxID=2607730 RepID=UPI0011F1F522|nr:hypothetical protein [Aquimarina sp. RZ0]KAA1247021.1 hypothetical protein F0000_04875 [Aquimarina sp. RZ0]
MNKITKKMIWVLCLTSISSLSAQTLLNGFFPKKNDLTIASSYSFKSFDNFFRGTTITEGNPADMGAINSSIFNLYGEYGVTNWLSTTINLPYISSTNENNVADPILGETEIESIQDLSLFLKAKIVDKTFSNSSRLSLGGASGVILPVGGYDGIGIMAIGQNSTAYEGCGFVQYNTSINLFLEVQAAYSLRENPDANVPDAMLYSAKLGYYNKWFYTHAKIGVQNSLTGFDLGSQEFADVGGPQALLETEVDYTNFYFDIYVPVYKDALGISSGYATNMEGRNYVNATSFSLGLVYKSN